MDNRIGIILTSIERPQALKKSVESILSVWQENWVLLIGDQDPKNNLEFIDNLIETNKDKRIFLYDLDYDCGISKARNELIHHASLWGCEYVLLTADSIIFDDSMKNVEMVALGMDIEGYKLCGLNLNNRIPWEADLDLVQIPEKSFVLDFIDPREKLINSYVPCRIVRNFWIARTEALIKVPYDNELIMCEHEDFFWRMKIEGMPVCCTNLCSGTYNKEDNTPEYNKLRATNFRIGMQRLMNKYSLKHWMNYKHLERTKQ